jgi:purine nucleosidase
VLACPDELDLMAVTTVGRNGDIRARVASGLLSLAGRVDVDVCTGEEQPLLRGPSRFNWFDHEERCVPDGAGAKLSSETAPECIVRLARQSPGLEIALIGPLTNLARALALDPELPGRLGGVTIMGGHVRQVRIGDFEAPYGIDYNLCSDPEASVAVLGAGLPITLVTADVTLSTWLRQEDLSRLDAAGALARELARQVRIWEPVQRRIFTQIGGQVAPENVAYLHDPLTLLALVDPSPIRFEELPIVPTVEDGVQRTREAPPGSGLGAVMRVATAVDAAAARDAIVERLLAGPPAR